MYEAVRARPAGPSTVARLAATAADYGFDGLVIANPPDTQPDFDPATIAGKFDIDVVRGIELAPSTPAEASGAVGHHRPDTPVLALRGGRAGLNEYAVRQDKLDVVAQPMTKSADLDHAMVKTAADYSVRLEIDLGPVLRSSGEDRSAAIGDLRKLRDLIEAYDVPFVVSARASSHLELRSPRELAAVAAVAGFEQKTIEAGLAEWGRLVARNRQRLSDQYVGPGVSHEGEVGEK